MKTKIIILLIALMVLFSNCSFFDLLQQPSPAQDGTDMVKSISTDPTIPDTPLQAISEQNSINDTETTENPSETAEADNFSPNKPPAINPLTGLPVSNLMNLLLPPALVSVTNFPPTARPQAGLSVSSIVFELYIGDGMTRYLALFYGEYPAANPGNLEGELTAGMKEPAIGPVRSGRIPYEHLRKLYNGFIVMASAYSSVADQLRDYVNVFGDDKSDVNSAMIPVDQIKTIAADMEKELGEAALGGMAFDETQPEGGAAGQSIWMFYSFMNQVFWRYNTTDGSYHRWQDNADGVTFIEQTDRLTGEPLSFENVIILLVDHEVDQKYFIDLDLLFVEKEKALIFRDGEVHQAYWTTKSEEYEQTTGKLRPIRFIDAEGNPFPLKPGQTWIELIPTHSPIWETVDSEKYHLLLNGRSKGSGNWAVWFAYDN